MFEELISIINILPPQIVALYVDPKYLLENSRKTQEVDIFSIMVPQLFKPRYVSDMSQNVIYLLHIQVFVFSKDFTSKISTFTSLERVL